MDVKTAKTRKRRKQENRENGENAKTRKRRKPENGENDENPKTAKSVPVLWFSISRFLVFSVFSVFWFSRFLVFSFRWPHPSGQVAFFMCLEHALGCTLRRWHLASFFGVVRRTGRTSTSSPGLKWRRSCQFPHPHKRDFGLTPLCRLWRGSFAILLWRRF